METLSQFGTAARDGTSPSSDLGTVPAASSVREAAPAPARQPVRVRCRRMAEADLGQAAALLATGFPDRDAAGWTLVLDLLRERAAPNGVASLGVVLEAESALVGVLLTITRPAERGPARCNMSSWYVEPAFRGYASLLVTAATRDRSVTYVNVSAQRHTRATIEAQGFRRYADGVFVGLPLLATHPLRRVRVVAGEPPAGVAVDPAERAVMRDHAGLDCLAVWCVADGEARPFLFLRRALVGGRVAAAHLVYCRDVADLARFGRPLGRFLARHGLFAAMVDANGPLPGLPGRFLDDRMPKYAKGAETPRLGDLAYTEAPLFGS